MLLESLLLYKSVISHCGFCAFTGDSYWSEERGYPAFFDFCVGVHSLVYARLTFSKLGKGEDSFLYTELTSKNPNLNVESTTSFNPL